MKPIKLFCIPYAGGTSEVYWKWRKFLSNHIELCPVEIAGRGKRICEPLPQQFEDVTEDLASSIMNQLESNERYAIYGHSMGSLLAFETYYKLMEKGCHAPKHMFFSGREAPQSSHKSDKPICHDASDEQFLQVVLEYGGTSEEVVQNQELLQLFLPILRADFKITETYKHQGKKEKIACDLTVINGTNDRSIMNFDINEWRFHAEKKCNIKKVMGGHFFIIEDSMLYVVDIVNDALQNV
ncbi:thioesterase II family protein [Paenibacillus sp. FSL R7-0331]|uniref:thioesterase II family protein n=1 Tax=Paenibacillus sp. FSL R7-0331 TaxID=1536773 RepID=UPI0004F74CF2|nr:thioesterase domain-containing protein [Paenibacillus sp. FSL R7-0331]AIQ51352.1 hypothetical protein R70331_07395 [Paenibacillus sp. FSL R7-0331]